MKTLQFINTGNFRVSKNRRKIYNEALTNIDKLSEPSPIKIKNKVGKEIFNILKTKIIPVQMDRYTKNSIELGIHAR